MTLTTEDRIHGCLIGSAMGDALGAPVEFMKLAAIKKKYGPRGIQEFDEVYGRIGAITDDTQMTIFTAEGLLASNSPNLDVVMENVHDRYLDWFDTQNGTTRIPERGFALRLTVNACRAPGNTCLKSLYTRYGKGAPHRASNDSCGCGGVMRVAPVGLLATSLEQAFYIGVRTAMLTHGSPEGYLPAGVIAGIVYGLCDEEPLRLAVDAAAELLACYPLSGPTSAILRRAVQNRNEVKDLGAGWRGDEAMAIAIRCAVSTDNYTDCVRMAVNHDGDSDSTGAIAGALAGAMYGMPGLPGPWIRQLEHADYIADVASKIVQRRTNHAA